MEVMKYYKKYNIRNILIILAFLALLPVTSPANEEVASPIRRYKAYEASTGYYEEYEAMPRRQSPFINIRRIRKVQPYSPSASKLRIRARLSDSHRGLKFYTQRKCEGCHIEHSNNIHTIRGNLTCRQCHGGEPIAGIYHYYSPLNPIRKHAYVCAKCHEGANASFASYVIHEPPAASDEARRSFPALYYTYWFMFLLLTGTLAFFIPHSILTGIRELFRKKENE